MQTLRILRKEKGLTMKGLGQRIGVAESTISQYENGKRQPDYETLLKLAEELEVTVDYLLTGTKKDPDRKVEVSEDDIKVALFGGDGDVTAEQWDEVKRFAEFVKLRDLNRSDGKTVQDGGKE